MNINVDLTFLRDWQKDFIKEAKQYNVLVCHRRSWKTTVCVAFLLYKALKEKGYYWYIAPTYKQGKAIAWDMLKKFAREIPSTKTNEAELTVELLNGSKIRIFWADNPDSLRWLDLRWVIFDEYAQQPANIYWEIVFPMLNANNWWSVWIWTPQWKNAFYDVYKRWTRDDKFYTKLLKASESHLLNWEQLNAAKEEMTEEEYQQEYECSFDAAIRWAYYSKEINRVKSDKRIRQWLFDPMLPVFTTWDLGISDYMTILFVQVHWNSVRIIDSMMDNWHWFDYYVWKIRDKELSQWYKVEKYYFPHDIEVRELTTWASRLETVREIFGASKVEVLPRLKIIDGINQARRIFHNVWFEEGKTDDLVECLSLYRQKYDEKRWIFLDNPEHDWTSHYADAFRYMAVAYNELTRAEEPNAPIMIDFSSQV